MRDELVRRFTEFGTRTAIFDQEIVFTYQELLDRIRYTQDVLGKHGVAPHDIVVVNGDYSPSSIATLFALFLNRNVVVPLVTLNERDLDTVTEHCRPKFLVRTGADLDVEELEAPASGAASMIDRLSEANASGLVLLSSGSTGAPKVILHNLDTLVGQKLEKRPRRRANLLNILMVLMFDHIGGINSLLSTLLVGGTAVLLAGASRTRYAG